MTSKNQLRTRRMSDSTFGFLLMVPALLVLLVVIAFPILKGIYASFCDYGLKELRKGIFDLKWNNFANYKIMLQNNQIFSYFKNTFVFVALVVVIQLILGMGIALLLNSKIKARGTLRGLMLVPWTIPSVVTAIVWRFMTNSSYGVINWIAYKLGMIPTLDYSWTLQSGSAMALIVIAAVWRQLPYMMVMILAGLQSVDKSLLEAGTIDGELLAESAAYHHSVHPTRFDYLYLDRPDGKLPDVYHHRQHYQRRSCRCDYNLVYCSL